MKTTAEMIREFFSAPADVKEFLVKKYDGALPINTDEPKKSRKLFKNDFAKMAKVERNLKNVLSRFSSLLDSLYIKTDGENFAHVDTHGEFMNLWELCVQEGDGAFETVTNWIYPDEIYIFDRGFAEPCPDEFKKIHFLENRREELLNKRDRLMEEYGDEYCFNAELFIN